MYILFMQTKARVSTGAEPSSKIDVYIQNNTIVLVIIIISERSCILMRLGYIYICVCVCVLFNLRRRTWILYVTTGVCIPFSTNVPARVLKFIGNITTLVYCGVLVEHIINDQYKING